MATNDSMFDKEGNIIEDTELEFKEHGQQDRYDVYGFGEEDEETTVESPEGEEVETPAEPEKPVEVDDSLLDLADPDKPVDEVKEETPPVMMPEAKKFFEDLEKFTGISAADLGLAVRFIKGQVHSDNETQFKAKLAQFNIPDEQLPEIESAILDHYSKLPPAKQALVGDHPEMILAYLLKTNKVQIKTTAAPVAARKSLVESADKGPAARSKQLTQRDIEKMSDEEYAKNADAIAAAYAAGLVKR